MVCKVLIATIEICAIIKLSSVSKEAIIMNGAKAAVYERLQNLPDEITDEMEVVERLYVLSRFEHSRKRCREEGVLSDEQVTEHFRKKKEQAGLWS